MSGILSHTPVSISEFKVRKAKHADIDAMVDLLTALFAIEVDFRPDPERQRRGLTLLLGRPEDTCCLRVAELNGEIVGMASAQELISTAQGTPVAMVEDVVVASGWRGRGVGRRLVAALEDWALGRGMSRLQLLADCNNNAALAFYERVGWKPTQLVCLRRWPGVSRSGGR